MRERRCTQDVDKPKPVRRTSSHPRRLRNVSSLGFASLALASSETLPLPESDTVCCRKAQDLPLGEDVETFGCLFLLRVSHTAAFGKP